MRFKDKVVIITGGGAGMGKASALGFAKEGARVFIFDRAEDTLKKAAEEIGKIGTVHPVLGDITKIESINSAINKALEQYGRIDILVNYAGGNPDNGPMRLFVEENVEYWDRVIELNLRSTMIFCRAVLDSMMKQKYGKIVNFAAMAGRVGGMRMVAYSAAKGGVIALTKALAKEMAQYNINVNCICPGPIATPGFATIFGADALKRQNDNSPMMRVGTSDEVASAVLYLASDEAAFITGQPLALDGGRTMI